MPIISIQTQGVFYFCDRGLTDVEPTIPTRNHLSLNFVFVKDRCEASLDILSETLDYFHKSRRHRFTDPREELGSRIDYCAQWTWFHVGQRHC